jgi:hypothetical protein
MREITFEINPFSYGSNLNAENYARKANISGVYLWGFNLRDDNLKIDKKEQIVIYYVGKSNSHIYERLMQEFSQLLFGGFGTILNWDYIKSVNTNPPINQKLFQLGVRKHQNNYENKFDDNYVVYHPNSIVDVLNFPNEFAKETLKEMRMRLIFTYFTLSEESKLVIQDIAKNIANEQVNFNKKKNPLNEGELAESIFSKFIEIVESYFHHSFKANILGGVKKNENLFYWDNVANILNSKMLKIPLKKELFSSPESKNGIHSKEYVELNKSSILTLNFSKNEPLLEWMIEVNQNLK